MCIDQGAIKEAFLSYYKELFWSSRLEGVEECLPGMEGRVTAEMNGNLKPCTTEEVSLALQHMGHLKLQA